MAEKKAPTGKAPKKAGGKAAARGLEKMYALIDKICDDEGHKSASELPTIEALMAQAERDGTFACLDPKSLSQALDGITAPLKTMTVPSAKLEPAKKQAVSPQATTLKPGTPQAAVPSAVKREPSKPQVAKPQATKPEPPQPAKSQGSAPKPKTPEPKAPAPKAPEKIGEQTKPTDPPKVVEEGSTFDPNKPEEWEGLVEVVGTGDYNGFSHRPLSAVARLKIKDDEIPVIETLLHADYCAGGQADLIVQNSCLRAFEVRQEFAIARQAAKEFEKAALLLARRRNRGKQKMLKFHSTQIGLEHKIASATTFAPGTPQAELVETVKLTGAMFKVLADVFQDRMDCVKQCVKEEDSTPYAARPILATMGEVRIWKALAIEALSIGNALEACEQKLASTNTQIILAGPGIGGAKNISHDIFDTMGGSAH